MYYFTTASYLPLPMLSECVYVCMCVFSNYCLQSLAFCLNISCHTGVLSINSLRLVYLGMSFFYFHFCRDNFTGYKTRVWQYFTFSTLNISSQCLLFSIVSYEKSAVNLTRESECDELFSFGAFMIFIFAFTSKHFTSDMSGCESLCLSCLELAKFLGNIG